MIDTLHAKKPLQREQRPFGTASRNRARYLVAEYLHDWGLRDPEVIAAESRRVVEQAESIVLSGRADAGERELCAAAIRITVDEVDASIARMAATSSRTRDFGTPTNGSIVPHMARVLLEFPEAIRQRDRPPARLLQMLESSVAPIVPCGAHREMRPQPRTRLWKLLRRGYWFCFKRRVKVWSRRLVEFVR